MVWVALVGGLVIGCMAGIAGLCILVSRGVQNSGKYKELSKEEWRERIMSKLKVLATEAGGKCPKSGIFRKKRHLCVMIKGYGFRCKWRGRSLYSLRREEGKL